MWRAELLLFWSLGKPNPDIIPDSFNGDLESGGRVVRTEEPEIPVLPFVCRRQRQREQ